MGSDAGYGPAEVKQGWDDPLYYFFPLPLKSKRKIEVCNKQGKLPG
jgi:hypothetical protein